jgi:hypothetical protein
MLKFKRFQKNDFVFSFFTTVLILSSLVLLSLSCKNDPVKPEQWQIQLTVDDASCTEAYLKLQVGTELSERTVTLKRNNIEIWTRNIETAEIAVIDTNLIPGHTYTYTANLLTPPPFWAGSSSTSQVQVRTMDTTNHNFTWQTFTLGDGIGSSVLYDVAIINDSCIWAVGNIRVNDTTYGAAVWNGVQWSLMIVPAHDYGSTTLYPSIVKTIWAFSSQSVYVATDANLLKWDGQSWSEKSFFMTGIPFTGQVNKMWASSENDIYCVGKSGSIYHYTGSGTWLKLESGTTLGLSGIFGLDGNTINACGLDYNQSKGVVLRKQGQSWVTVVEGDIIDSSELFKPKLYGITEGLWIDEKGTVYTVGNFIYQFNRGKWDYARSLAGNTLYSNPGFLYRGYLHAIRGNASNDMVIAGEINTVRHFNGISWVQIGEPYQPLNYNAFWYGCDIKNNMMIAVGDEDGRATILLARR